MSNVVTLRPNEDIPETLRRIADDIDAGIFHGITCTMILDTEIFAMGQVPDDNLTQSAVWDMTYGIHKLMSAGLGES